MPSREELARIADKIKITCPYCFRTFSDREVIFRSNFKYEADDSGGISLNDLVMNAGGSSGTDEDEDKALFAPYGEPYDPNSRKRDEELEAFWENRGGASGFTSADPRWNYPHIDPGKPAEFKRMIQYGGNADPDGFVRDKDGWIQRVNEKYADNWLEMTRLCPYCHNPLPFTDYGKYPVKIISIVGIRASGKTVYLDQLLSRFVLAAAHTGYVMGATTYNARGTDHVEKGSPLPPSTDDKVMRRPSAFTLQKLRSNEGFTVVFYDIAGENCVPPARAAGGENNGSAVSNFIGHSDGLLFLIDPEQVPVFARGSGKGEKDVQDVINTVKAIGTQAQGEKWDDKPVAVVLTKSDTFETNSAGIDPIIFRHINYQNPDGSPVVGFNRREYLRVSQTLRQNLLRNTQFIMPALNSFGRKGFFAVSAITCGVEERFEEFKNTYVFDDENRKKFHMYRELIGEWNRRSPAERPRFADWHGIKDADGNIIEAITCEQNIAFGSSFWDTPTEVKAYYRSKFGTSDVINLTVGDLTKNINTQVYPKDDPNPRRVEEPFLWILWELGLIPPEFMRQNFPEQEPVRGLLESRRKYEQRCDEYKARQKEWENQQITKEKEFYGLEDSGSDNFGPGGTGGWNENPGSAWQSQDVGGWNENPGSAWQDQNAGGWNGAPGNAWQNQNAGGRSGNGWQNSGNSGMRNNDGSGNGGSDWH